MTECVKCSAALLPVSDMPNRRRDDWTVQFWDVLAIEFMGGYGMFMDPMAASQSQRDCTVVLCKSCAAAFLDENEWARAIVEPDHPAVYRVAAS
jgi:hypothetical protein